MTENKNNKENLLNAEKRTLFGKKLKRLRQEGKIPANVFGKDFSSTSITVNEKEFKKIYQKVKQTGILYLQLEKEELPVLISQIQLHPISHQILHIDFRKVDLKQKLVTEVPIKIVGESPAVEQKGGYLLVAKDKLQIEALPEEIPSEITIDISTLTEFNQEIKVNQIKIEGKYEFKEHPQTTVVSVIAHKEEKIEPQTAPVTETTTTETGEKAEATTESSTPTPTDNQSK
jgi:large subunit ribosomal protein L25